MSGVGSCVRKKLLHYIGRHFLQKIHGVIGHQIVNDIGRFFDGQGLYDCLLAVHFQIGKDICRQILGKDAVNLEDVLLFQFFHECRDICVIQLRKKLTKFCILLGF